MMRSVRSLCRRTSWHRGTAARCRGGRSKPGFNLVAWEGGTVPAADTLGGLGDVLQGAWLWDAIAGVYLTYNPGLPAALNSLVEIPAGQALWIRVSATTELSGPAAC